MTPSIRHEATIDLCRKHPPLVAELLEDILGIPIPEFRSTSIEAADFNQPQPKEFRADAVISLRTTKPELVVIVEMQLRNDPSKRWTWPLYLTVARERMKCPAALLVICADPKVAKKLAMPIELGHPGLVLRPLVVGPDQIPLIKDPQEATRTPALAVLSAMTHADGPEGDKALQGVMGIYEIKERDMAVTYDDILRAALSPASRVKLEVLMKKSGSPYLSEFATKNWAKGKAEGMAEGMAEGKAEGIAERTAEAIIIVLFSRKIAITDEERTKVLECTDTAQLETWLRRAATVESAEDVFAD